jgi:DNA-binding MarR family transcriptional regulator
MLHVTATISGPARPAARRKDDLTEQIIREFEPIVALQRRSMGRIWQDRSVSKLNLHLLMLLSSRGPMPMSRLAALADVSLPSLTGIVDRMEERGLAERVRDEHDRRVVLVQVTDLGRTSCEEFEAVPRETMRRILAQLPTADQRTVLRAFRAMRRAVELLEPELASPTPHPQATDTRGARHT